MRLTVNDNKMATFMVFANDSFDDDNNGYAYGVELHQNGDCINVEWFKTQEEQQREYDELNRELSRGEW